MMGRISFVVQTIFSVLVVYLFLIEINSFICKSSCAQSRNGRKSASKANESDNMDYLWNGKKLYYETASSLNPTTDKVTHHTYHIMYGRFLLPYYQQNPNMKMLEIGLGCDMFYGPGASVAVYKALFPRAELWEAEYNGDCVENAKNNGMLNGINTLVGDQGNVSVLDEWIATSNGNFDVIIDDGGHQNCQIWQSFMKLWPTVKPGGLYFIEDMQVARRADAKIFTTTVCGSDLLVPDKMKAFVDDLIYDTSRKSDLEFIFCQSEACVLGKKSISSN